MAPPFGFMTCEADLLNIVFLLSLHILYVFVDKSCLYHKKLKIDNYNIYKYLILNNCLEHASCCR